MSDESIKAQVWQYASFAPGSPGFVVSEETYSDRRAAQPEKGSPKK